MSEPKHCEHWYEGSDECHRCGDFPMMRRLNQIVAGLIASDNTPCVESDAPCPDHVTWNAVEAA